MKSDRLASLRFSMPLLALVLAPLVPCVAACGAPSSAAGEGGEALGVTSAPIVNGVNSDATQNAVVRIAWAAVQNGQEGGFSCTGTLLAPNLVITARHCVSSLSSDTGFACDENGKLLAGDDSLGADFDPTTLFIQLGVTLSAADTLTAFTTGDAHGTKIFHDSSTTLCNHDEALILLDHDIAGAQLLPIRLSSFASAGEAFTAVGWGVTTSTQTPTTRQQRTGLAVSAVGPANDATLDIGVGANEFSVGEVTCEGDSGGPAISTKTGAVIGTVSRGGNQSTSTVLAADCTGAGTANLYSQPAGFKDVITQAYAAAGQAVWEEGQPAPAPIPAPSTGSSRGCASAPAPRGDWGDSRGLALLGIAGVTAVLARRRARR